VSPEQAGVLVDPWAFGPWCWIIDEVIALPERIPCGGRQGTWHLNDEQIRAFGDAGIRTIPSYGLTLLQPYASAILDGPKRVENRPWRRNLPPKGRWYALHAGKALYPRAGLLTRMWQTTSGHDGAPPFGLWPEAPPVDTMPRSAIIGAFHVRAIVRYPEQGPLFQETT
jgi:hypothetical protein